MQRYICHDCDDLECNSEICPICGGHTASINTEIYWCPECNAPSFSQICTKCHNHCSYLASDLRPVFPEERLLLEVLLGKPMKYAGSSVWSSGSGTYFINGNKIKLNYAQAMKNDPIEIRSLLEKYSKENRWYIDHFFESENIRAAININREHINEIQDEALSFIRSKTADISLSSMFVSFSGGKDSTVISNLAIDALGSENVLHIYGDTTLEYPDSELYLKRFRLDHKKTPILVARNRDQNFIDLCNKIGPPSRVLRWCCTVFKTGAINRLIETMFTGKSKVIAFHGIRRVESISRSKYERVSESPKITKQIVIQPILDWMNFDVWMYIITKHLDFNDAYRKGFSRVGCWCCPNNSAWAGYLASIYMPEQSANFTNVLYDFAKSVNKPDWKEYIDSGSWKARQGGNGLEYSKNAVIDFKPCAFEENAYNFELSKPISEDLYTLFKPFGIIDRTIGNPRLGEVYILNRSNSMPLMRITGKVGQNKLKVSVLNYIGPFSVKSRIESYIKAQITKYQTCIGCSACASVCKHSAIKVENTNPGDVSVNSIKYEIDDKKCVGCLDCILHFDSGCYMKKVLRVKNEVL